MYKYVYIYIYIYVVVLLLISLLMLFMLEAPEQRGGARAGGRPQGPGRVAHLWG